MDERYERFSDGTNAMARGLGWFSLGLGAAELLFGARLSRAMGIGDHGAVMRAYGLREIAAGMMILASDDPRLGVWSRVAGDVVDLATLAPGLSADNPERERTRMAVGIVAGALALDVACAQALHLRERHAPAPPDYSDRVGIRH